MSAGFARPRRVSVRGPLLARSVLAAWTFCVATPVFAAPAVRGPLIVTRQQADSLATSAPSPARDKALAEWAKRARTRDVVWVLRRSAAELASAELPLLDGALASTPPERAALRQRLLARRALAAPRALKKGETPLPDLAALHPYTSVFRVAALFPDAGEYAGYGRALRAALADGLAYGRSADAPAFELDTLGTGDSDPARVAAALERTAGRADVIVGELLSSPTLSLATATRLTGQVLVSPTATDERIHQVGPRVFQLGPAVAVRAHVLAEAVLRDAPHSVAIAGSAAGIRGAFATAFALEVEARGGKVVRRDVVPASGPEVALLAASLKASGADVLLWDGSSRDAEALVRALATAGAALRVCGGPALAPEAMRPAARPLLEGVTYVDDDWHLPAATRVRLDSLAAATSTRSGSQWTRGFLAGRCIAAAVDAGALTASEIADQLHAPGDTTRAGGFLDLTSEQATLMIYVVRHGKAVEARGAQDQ